MSATNTSNAAADAVSDGKRTAEQWIVIAVNARTEGDTRGAIAARINVARRTFDLAAKRQALLDAVAEVDFALKAEADAASKAKTPAAETKAPETKAPAAEPPKGKGKGKAAPAQAPLPGVGDTTPDTAPKARKGKGKPAPETTPVGQEF